MLTVFPTESAVARSRCPSPSRSATITAAGPLPTTKSATDRKLPSPLPMRTLTVFEAWLATSRSGIPSAFKSATARDTGPFPTEVAAPALNVPSPLPNSTWRELVEKSAAARSMCPSVLRSTATIADSTVSTLKLLAGLKPPLASPLRILIEPSALAEARSGFPSPSKSPMANAWGEAPVAYSLAAWKEPSPLFFKTEILFAPALATSRSGWLCPARLRTARNTGPLGTP